MAVSRYSDAVGVGNAKPHGLIDRGLGVGDELFQVSVVSFLRIADDGERGVVDDRVTPSSSSLYSYSWVKVSCEPATWPAVEASA